MMSDSGRQLVRQLYGEAQQWARHYEALLVQANVLIVPVALGFLGFAFATDKASQIERATAIVVSAMMAALGFLLVRMLFGLYATTIERMIRLERSLGCFDADVGNRLDGGGALLADDLAVLPVKEPPSVRFFKNVYRTLAGLIPIAFLYLMLFPRKGC